MCLLCSNFRKGLISTCHQLAGFSFMFFFINQCSWGNCEICIVCKLLWSTKSNELWRWGLKTRLSPLYLVLWVLENIDLPGGKGGYCWRFNYGQWVLLTLSISGTQGKGRAPGRSVLPTVSLNAKGLDSQGKGRCFPTSSGGVHFVLQQR